MQKRGSHIIITDSKGRISLQQRDSTTTKSPDTWGLWGGHAEGDEAPAECALRELREETGIEVETDTLLLLYEFERQEDGMLISVFHLPCEEIPKIALGEGQGYGVFTPNEIKHLTIAPTSAISIERFLKTK